MESGGWSAEDPVFGKLDSFGGRVGGEVVVRGGVRGGFRGFGEMDGLIGGGARGFV